MKEEQLELKLGIELKPIILPETNFDLVEQLAFALQNRDAIGLRQLIDKDARNSHWGSREDFIHKFTGFCERMEQKHGSIYVHTVPGQCGRERCIRGASGLGVTVNTINDNKQLWRFNLVFEETQRNTVIVRLCQQFEVKSDEIPF